jgi:hypothetical protein
MPAKTLFPSRRSRYIGYDSSVPSPRPPPKLSMPRAWTCTSSAGRGTGSVRSITWSSSVKTAVLAAIPNAIEKTATDVKRGTLRRDRIA